MTTALNNDLPHPAKAPVLFISHGAPTFAIEPGDLGPRLTALGDQLQGVRAVLVVSPHWQTRDVKVMTTAQPPTVHDFGGFPAELYTIQYPAPGQPDVAQEAARLLSAAGFSTSLEANRGLDHGAWVPLFHMLPQAHVPVFQVSMPVSLTTAQAVALGQALAPLREQGVVIVGSGSMTHNLHEFFSGQTEPAPYAVAFAKWIQTAVQSRSTQALIRYRSEAPHAARAHPTEDHFLPLLVALGASHDDDSFHIIDDTITYGMLSMESYVWGMPTAH